MSCKKGLRAYAILGGMMLSKLYSGEVHKDLNLFKVDRFDH
ncbi:hypothetical protein [Clostridium sp.]